MNVLKYRVSLDMFDVSSQKTIKAKKGDSACQIHITLTENSKIYKIGEGCHATFTAKKSDGNFIYDNCTIEGDTIVYDFSSSIDKNGVCQVSAMEGNVECEITLYNANNEQLTSPRFTLYIDGTIYNGEEIESSFGGNVFSELVKKIDNKPGSKVADGGEIFNDYENNKALHTYAAAEGSNNVASCMGFKISNLRMANTSIDDVTGERLLFEIEGDARVLEDVANYNPYNIENPVSIQWGNNYDLCCNVLGILGYAEEDNITYGAFTELPFEIDLSLATSGYLWIPTNPEIGNVPLGTSAHAEGDNNKAVQTSSHAEGYNNISAGKYSHTEGRGTIAVYTAHAEGEGSNALGQASHTEGYYSKATGHGAHAEGGSTLAQGKRSHAEGDNTKALGTNAHAENHYAIAEGIASHAEGLRSHAKGHYSHAQGIDTQATATGSHAGGQFAQATADYSFAHGSCVRAVQPSQFSVGKNNKFNNTQDVLFMVGNGESTSARSNAFEVYKDGHTEVQTVGDTDKSVITKKYVDTNFIKTKVVPSELIVTLKPDGSTDTLGFDIENKAYALVRRDGNGCIKIGTPTDDLHAANKAYVDNGLNNLSIVNKISGGEETLTVNDVSPLAHKCSLKLTSDRYESANIYKFDNENIEFSNEDTLTTATCTFKENGTFIIDGAISKESSSRLFINVYSKDLTLNETYTISLRNTNKNFLKMYNAVTVYEDGTVNEDFGNYSEYTITPTKNVTRYCFMYGISGEETEDPYFTYLRNETLYPQLELGAVVTEWQEYGGVSYIEDFSTVTVYVNGTSYTPTADGTVTDIASVSPTMEITTNNEKANICDFTYCVDTKKYIDNGPEWELIEEITVTEEAVVERTYTEKYKKMVVVLDCVDKLPKVRLHYGPYGVPCEYWTYTEYQNRTIVVYGEIVIPNVYNNAYSWVGEGGSNSKICGPITDRLIYNHAEYYKGFETDNVCKVGTTIKVYGVKS